MGFSHIESNFGHVLKRMVSDVKNYFGTLNYVALEFRTIAKCEGWDLR